MQGNPMNWSRPKKWAATIALGCVTFCVTFASSVFSPGTAIAAEEFGVSIEVMVLGTALFVLAIAFGPILWGPFSEIYGRKIPLFAGIFVFAIFQIPVAVSQNLTTFLVCRFLQGFFGSAPLSITGGALADFWAPVDRGVAVSIFSAATFLGPTGGPIVGGFLTETAGYGWRWTAWVTLFATVFFGIGGWIFYPESFGPVLLQKRARMLRYATKNWAIHAPADEIEINLKAILQKYLAKPFLMLAFEPILLLMTIYVSFIYGILCESDKRDSARGRSLTLYRPVLRNLPDLIHHATRLESRHGWPSLCRGDDWRCRGRMGQLRLDYHTLQAHPTREGASAARRTIGADDGGQCRAACRPFPVRMD